MLLWFVFAFMTALATLAVLWPLGRARASQAAEAHELAVYRDQLAELTRDRERGLIGEAEAEAARTEIARRALRAAEGVGGAVPDPGRTLARPAAVATALAIPLIALATYLTLGSPDLPGQPLAARLDRAGEGDVAAMVARVEQHLAANPDDAEGWRVLAPVYARAGQYDRAAEALRNLIRITGPDPGLQEDLGELLVAANEGVVGTDAEAEFKAALETDPTRVKARYYRALAHVQAGRTDAAIADYDEILKTSPADAPWVETVKRDRSAALMAAGKPADTPAPAGAPAAAPGPDATAIAAAGELTADERAQMIAGMVDGLAARLKADPNDPDGWQRLIRAYGVLGRAEDARAAWETAKATFSGAPDTLAGIRAVAEEAGVAVE